MPELPEVETVRRGLAPVMEGARIERVVLARADLRRPFPEHFAARLAGRTVRALGRRAKYLAADLDDGWILVVHLGMSGSMRIEGGAEGAVPGVFHHPRERDGAHDHVTFHLDGGTRIVFNDPRRFGLMDLVERARFDEHPLFRGLGVEPTGNALDATCLAERLAGRQTSLKAALMDQRLVAGLGNIYVCEALHRAALSPLRRAHTLGRPGARAVRLAEAVRAVVAEAIEAGGSSLRDHARADGTLGYFQHVFRVYGREGAPCPRAGCGGTVQRIVQSARSTFHCPRCQR